jgi:hypothetical protein
MATRKKNGDDIPHLTLMVLHEIRIDGRPS